MDLTVTIENIKEWCQGRAWFGRAVLIFFLAAIGCQHAANPMYSSIFGGINLGIHELGHVVFVFFGLFMMILGGTLLQLAAPLTAIYLFARQPDYFAVSVAGVWLSTNLYNIAAYVADARFMVLPLVSTSGGAVYHDWNYLLFRLNLLRYDQVIARFLRLSGFVSMWASIMLGIWLLYLMAGSKPQKTKAELDFER